MVVLTYLGVTKKHTARTELRTLATMYREQTDMTTTGVTRTSHSNVFQMKSNTQHYFKHQPHLFLFYLSFVRGINATVCVKKIHSWRVFVLVAKFQTGLTPKYFLPSIRSCGMLDRSKILQVSVTFTERNE